MHHSQMVQVRFQCMYWFEIFSSQDDDLISAVEESALLQRKYDKYLDMVIVNEDFDVTFRAVTDALEALSHEHQWVPVNWIY